jgi:hypothetical protein
MGTRMVRGMSVSFNSLTRLEGRDFIKGKTPLPAVPFVLWKTHLTTRSAFLSSSPCVTIITIFITLCFFHSEKSHRNALDSSFCWWWLRPSANLHSRRESLRILSHYWIRNTSFRADKDLQHLSEQNTKKNVKSDRISWLGKTQVINDGFVGLAILRDLCGRDRPLHRRLVQVVYFVTVHVTFIRDTYGSIHHECFQKNYIKRLENWKEGCCHSYGQRGERVGCCTTCG